MEARRDEKLDFEVEIEFDAENGLEQKSAGQCQHIRSVAVARIDKVRGNVGAATLSQLREVIGVILDVNG